MLVLRSAALLIALIMMSAPRTAVGQAQSQPTAIAPEHQDMAAKRAKEREKINNCQKQATEHRVELHFVWARSHNLLNSGHLPHAVVGIYSGVRLPQVGTFRDDISAEYDCGCVQLNGL